MRIATSERITFGLPSSEELDVLSIDAGDLGDLPALSPQYEELIEVVTCAVVKLNIEWPAEKQCISMYLNGLSTQFEKGTMKVQWGFTYYCGARTGSGYGTREHYRSLTTKPFSEEIQV